MAEIPLYRLYILRAYYALVAFGTMAVFWPDLLSHTDRWGIDNGAQYSLIGALSPLMLLGIRYPIKMLPVVMYEFLWKSFWFIFVAWPLWKHAQMTEQEWSNVFACGISVVLTPFIVPWSYLWRTYGSARTERWS